MTITDIALLGILLFFVWNGYMTGFVLQVVRFVGGFVAFWAAKTYSPPIAAWLKSVLGQPGGAFPGDPIGYTGIGGGFAGTLLQDGYGILAFVLVFAAGLLLTQLAGRVVDLVVSLPGLSFVNRVAGLVAGLLIGFLILVVAVNVAYVLPIPNLHTALEGSQVASALLHAGLSKMLFAK
ncbi:CvpA family protein [Effusibacillus pohliae]|uniref:CvpA family protein n=1 Tax=Effusibacillus pohliae TaxID=232270 RepID=UPI000364E24F|nr:CvpA family protein [Effusibacillus pohliae]